MLRKADTRVHRTPSYEAHIDLAGGFADIRRPDDPSWKMRIGLIIDVEALDSGPGGSPRVSSSHVVDLDGGALSVTLELSDSGWRRHRVEAVFAEDSVAMRATVEGEGQNVWAVRALTTVDRDGSQMPVAELYSPRFDWFAAQVRKPTAESERLGAQQWLSPPPLVYVVEGDRSCAWVAACASADELDFVSMDWIGGPDCAVELTYEGHRTVRESFTTPLVTVGFTRERGNAAVREAVEWQRERGLLPRVTTKHVPHWWGEPIFCGWGQMRADYRDDHQGHENGNFINVTAYCTELRYRNYLSELDARGVDPGTIVIDMGWAEKAALARPHPHRWQDLRGFIDEQHARGRRVLLWFAPSVLEGLPVEACMTLDGVPIAPDPTAPTYRAILRDQIRLMLSSGDGCLDADGFKIDFTQCYPSEDGTFTSAVPNFAGLINETDERYLYSSRSRDLRPLIQTHGERWGIGLIRDHIELIYSTMKTVKPDSALMTHTANPVFADVVDILRLNDLDGDCDDVLGVMQNRAELARISCEHWLIDTDDDLMIDKDHWLAYARLQPRLGIPDTYYVSGIAHSGEAISDGDWAEVRTIWEAYRRARA